MKKLTPKLVDKIFIIAVIVGMLIGYGGVYSEIMLVSIFGIVIMICAIIFKIFFYRCPHCSRFLDRSTGDFCQFCGKKI